MSSTALEKLLLYSQLLLYLGVHKMRLCIAMALALLTLAIATLLFAHAQAALQSIVVDESGVATVTITATVDAGVTEVVLPVSPIATSIDVSSSVSGVEWIYENNTLYIASPERTSVVVKYIANASIKDGTIAIDVKTNSSVKLEVAPTILLLTLPERIINMSTLPGGWLEIVFIGPATITYTVIQPTKTTTTPTTAPPTTTATQITQTLPTTKVTQTQITSPTTSPSPTPTTPTTPTTTPATPSPVTPTQTTTPARPAIPVEIVVIAVIVIVIVAILVLALKKR